ncbi:hypothetical protein CR513_46255, partial [Mucuna pruriens]
MVKFSIRFGNNTNIPILGKCQVTIILKDGSQNFIFDTSSQLIEYGQLSKKGYNMQIHHVYCTEEHVYALHVLNIPNGVCETCEFGKKCKESFPTGKSWRVKKILEIVHSNMCIIEIPKHGGNNGYRIKTLRIDNGQEYLVYTNFFEQHGIQHQLTTRYMP